MARRSNFLVVTLLIMVAVLIGAILFGGGSGDPSPLNSTGGPAGGPVSPQGGDPRSAALGDRGSGTGSDPAMLRESVPTPLQGSDTGRVTLRGRLVRADRTVLAGAALEWNDELRLEDPIRIADPKVDRNPHAESGSDGRFALTVSSGANGSIELGNKAAVLFATTDRRTLPVRMGEIDQDLGDLLVVEALTLRGLILDEAGQPLALASVRVGDGPFLMMGGGRENIAVDGEGRFVVAGLEPGSCSLWASAPGFIPEPRRVDVTRDPPMGELRIQLKRGASVSGIVTDDLGRPLEGAKINALRKTRVGGSVEVEQYDQQGSVLSGASGAFVLTGIEGDAANLRVTHSGHASESVANVAVGRADVFVRMQRLGSISGVLRDAAGNPLAGSTVHARTGGGDVAVVPSPLLNLPGDNSTHTGADGAFTLADVRPGAVTLSAEGESHLPLDGVSVQLVAGARVEHVQMVAEVGAGLDVLVQDEKGKPVAGAEVVIAEPDEPEPTQAGPGTRQFRMSARAVRRGPNGPQVMPGDDLRRGTTNAEGRVLVGGLPSKPVVVKATHESLAPAKVIPVTVPQRGTREVIATLRPAGFVKLRVTDAEGKPMAGTRFLLKGPDGEDTRDERGSSDADGAARVGPLLAGRYIAELQLPPEPMDFGGMSIVIGDGGASLEDTRQTLEVRAGEEVELTLVRPVLTTLSGIVSDATGVVRGAEVRLERVTDQPSLGIGGQNRRTDTNGRYEFTDVAAGAWRLEWKRAERPVPNSEEFQVLSGMPQMERNLRIGGGSVRVRVTSGIDQMPLARADVKLRPKEASTEGSPPTVRSRAVFMISASADGNDDGGRSVSMQSGPASVRTDDDGVAVLEEVPPGEYDLLVEHRKHSDGRQPSVIVTDGTQTDIGSIELKPAGSIRGKVTGFATDDGPRAAMVAVHRVDGVDADDRHETAMNGVVHIERLEPGEYDLFAEAMPGDGKPGPVQRVKVVAGEVTRVELALSGR